MEQLGRMSVVSQGRRVGATREEDGEHLMEEGVRAVSEEEWGAVREEEWGQSEGRVGQLGRRLLQ